MAHSDGPNPDATSDPIDDPRGATQPAPAAEPPVDPAQAALDRHTSLGHTKAAATWTGLVIGVVVLILLLVFILQNLDQVALQLFFWEFSLPLGVSLLLAAIAGALIMALAGGVRIVQIRRVAKKARSTSR
ncbi:lipopolysaccharide assembly protein LapA domain-containing protein [Rhodococcus sp. UNC363MFTsu5.1]|uniref:lipopolysaccharide assembly protein LapA domain-containing protein n=1 Tax=Rhodococcus sp. UNC363MFTsu5.1 TaxID=1449069 RepID=UPI000566DAF3|nr:lipopolysaccharide assembly protein LapA domain-containing protein [Rhodococcus sp. UNC363MFTsu5.1]